VVLDLFARKVVGWATVPDMQASRVCGAPQMAIVQRQPDAGLVMHSDCGSQHAGASHQALWVKHGLVGRIGRQRSLWRDVVFGAVNGSSR
jgi:putative transposase